MAECVSLSQTVEKVAERVLSGEKHIPIMYRQTVGAETENATAMGHKDLRIVGSGGAEGDRTPDLLTASQVLSQLSYCPESERDHMRMTQDCQREIGWSISTRGRIDRLRSNPQHPEDS